MLGALLDAGEFMTTRPFESRVARIGIQVVSVGLVMVGTGGLLFLVGGFLLPGEPVQVASESPTVASTAVQSFVLPSLDDLEGTTAVIVVDGDIRGRFVLDRLNASSLSEDGRFTLLFRNGELDSLVIAGSGAPGTPISGEALDILAALGGINFFGFRGQCSGQLDSIEMHETIFVKDFWYVGPTGAGTVTCTGLTALSSGQTVSFEAVFRFDQRECAGGCE